MKILGISDIHGTIFDRKLLNGIDICCLVGDLFDDNYQFGQKIQYLTEELFVFISSLNNITFLCTFGNHDNALKFIFNRYRCLLPKNLVILDNSCYLKKLHFYGIPYIIEDEKICNYPFYQRYIDKYKREFSNLQKIDVLLTHNCPINENFQNGTSIVNWIIQQTEPKIVLCGHNHNDTHEPIKIGESIIYNVAQFPRIIQSNEFID